MKTLLLLFSTLSFSISTWAQYPPVPNLPAVNPQSIGFNRDSINALDDFISDFDQNEVSFSNSEQGAKESNEFNVDSTVLQSIVERMTVHHDFLDPNLSLQEFATRCKLPKKTVSQYINQGLEKTFHDYVNGYRVEEFKEKVVQAKDQNLTLEGLAYESGFNSKATFNRIFKKNTGLTPSEFVSKHR